MTVWEPVAPPPERRLRPLRERVADKFEQTRRVALETAKIRVRRLRSSER